MTVKYNPVKHPTLVKQYGSEGLSMVDISEKLSISIRTLYQWEKLYPEFKDALEEGRYNADVQVENTLYNRLLTGKKTYKRKTVRDPIGQVTLTEEYITEDEDLSQLVEWMRMRRFGAWGEDYRLTSLNPQKSDVTHEVVISVINPGGPPDAS